MISLTRLTKPVLVLALLSAVYLFTELREPGGADVRPLEDLVGNLTVASPVTVPAAKKEEKQAVPEGAKTILMWNDGYGTNELGLVFGGQELFQALNCEETR
jgi:hypothetical protein